MKKENGSTMKIIILGMIILLVMVAIALVVILVAAKNATVNTQNNNNNNIVSGQNTISNTTTQQVVNSIVSLNNLQVGQYINYDAGVWTSEDVNKILYTTTETLEQNITGLKITDIATGAVPTTFGQFGGFKIGQSRSTNAIPSDQLYSGGTNSGWRVWDVETDMFTGKTTVTLVTAGCPEDYYHSSGINLTYNSEMILTGSTTGPLVENEASTPRDFSMYENAYALQGSAKVLTKQMADEWYNKNIDSSVTDLYTLQTLPTEVEQPLITLLDNQMRYWLPQAVSAYHFYYMMPETRRVSYSYDNAFGIRLTVQLNPDVKIVSGDGTRENPYTIAM